MRQFIVRTVTGRVDPENLLERLWPGPQLSRMLTYSVVIHFCLATSLMLLKAFNVSFGKIPTIVYTVDLVEFERAKPELVKKNKKIVAVKPKPKPRPKPEPEPKPEPKPEVKKKTPPAPENKPALPKAVKPPPEKKPPVVETKPEPPKKEPPPPPEPEPVKVAKAVEPEPEPVALSMVKLDTDFITPELKWYIEIIRRKVWKNWIEPRHALSSASYARVVIRFEIGPTGSFALQPEILDSSNNPFFDQSGFRAVIRSAPFPPLPESFTGETLGVRFGFEYGESA